MTQVFQSELDKMIAKVDMEIGRLTAIKNKLLDTKLMVADVFVSEAVQVAKRPEPKVKEVRDKKVVRRCSWADVREVLKQLYPEMLTVTQIAELMGMPRSIISYHTSTMRRLLKRDYVKTPGKLHWEYKMTLKNPPHVDGALLTAEDLKATEGNRPILAIDKYV